MPKQQKQECVAMILAGGQGSRLGVLTQKLAKPAVPFGGKYRIIDFPLSNCYNSGIYTVGVLTQYQPLALHTYIGIGSSWDLDRQNGGVYILPPYAHAAGAEWYSGTADAICQNIKWLEAQQAEHVVILSGDHIYKMNYASMLEQHIEQQADVTIAVIEVPAEEACRFGIMSTDETGRIVDFEEKPAQPKSNLASMGVYVFRWAALREYLLRDQQDAASEHDFGKNIIPNMLADGARLFSYAFRGYWKDVGTIESYWQANMDLLADQPELDLYDVEWAIFAVNPAQPPHYVGASGSVNHSMVAEGCRIDGRVEKSVLFYGAQVGEGAVVQSSVVMGGVKIGAGAQVCRAILAPGAVVEPGAVVGSADETVPLTVVGEQTVVACQTRGEA